MSISSYSSDLARLLCADKKSFFNCRKKFVFDENGEQKLLQIMCTSEPVFNPYGLERKAKKTVDKQKLEREREVLLASQTENMTSALDDVLRCEEEKNQLCAARRAKRKVSDYISANSDLCLFVTFTLNGESFSRYDVSAACKRLNKYLANRVQRNGLKYVFVPELHKDGAVHFHGLINEVVPLVSSGTFIPPTGGKPLKKETLRRKGIALSECAEVFNMPDWAYGFSTAIKLYGERSKAASYVAKYVTKGDADKARKICGRYYYSSNNLRQPFYEYSNEDFERFEGYEIETEFLHAKIQNV